ncbi:hypothetical protein PUN28_010709 [Cardiocondyla obscurior]|uniref:Uncharacterized protein n=1 Tax=Cardiocondyla obscurior TaxID=286306 RepID=A0AAW2FJZ5_9HYME
MLNQAASICENDDIYPRRDIEKSPTLFVGGDGIVSQQILLELKNLKCIYCQKLLNRVSWLLPAQPAKCFDVRPTGRNFASPR